jgi:ribosomal protein S12 methylthiotransferase
LTYYGIDLYGKQTIAQLVEKMSEIPGVEWIRLHYAYPAHFPVDLLRVMREKKNVCKYLDIALQHVADNMLTRMRRNITKAETVALIKKIREEVPGICLRTTLMVGFPGETDDDFRQLCEFVKEMRFERMGAFAYSEEEGTYAAINYEDDVPNEVKQQRLDELMAIQQRISMEVSGSYVGRKLKIIIDRKEGEYYIGRTEYDSPEVDCEVLINEKEMKIGGYYQGYIDSADEFDLYASIVE